MIPSFYVIIWNNRPVGLDSNLGGYPFKTEYPSQIKYWSSVIEARKYMDMFPEKDWIIMKVNFVLESV